MFNIKCVLKRCPGSEPDSAERCSCGSRGGREGLPLICCRLLFSSKAHPIAGADVGLEDDTGMTSRCSV